jgi:hypothetical protein
MKQLATYTHRTKSQGEKTTTFILDGENIRIKQEADIPIPFVEMFDMLTTAAGLLHQTAKRPTVRRRTTALVISSYAATILANQPK